MSTGIYKITNNLNGKIYIGQSVNIESRWKQHRTGKKSLISRAIKKYGKENFTFEILEECDISLLNEKEEYYIKYYNCIAPNGYNIQGWSDGIRVYSYPEYIKEMWEDLLNSNLSFKEIANKYGLGLRIVYYIKKGESHYNPALSYPLRKLNIPIKKNENKCQRCGQPIDRKAKLCVQCYAFAQRVTEWPSKKELKQLIRIKSFVEIGKMFNVTDKAVVKWCKHYNLPYRKCDIKTYTDEEWEEEKFDQLGSLYKKEKEKNTSNQSIAVEQYDLKGNYIQTFTSCLEAAKALNKISSTSNGASAHISNVCKGKRKTAYGYIWKFANQSH